jgi:hypothetical protein
MDLYIVTPLCLKVANQMYEKTVRQALFGKQNINTYGTSFVFTQGINIYYSLMYIINYRRHSYICDV